MDGFPPKLVGDDDEEEEEEEEERVRFMGSGEEVSDFCLSYVRRALTAVLGCSLERTAVAQLSLLCCAAGSCSWPTQATRDAWSAGAGVPSTCPSTTSQKMLRN